MYPALESDQPQPETVIERRERAETLQKGLARLTPDRRLVLSRFLDGHSTPEIAVALEMNEALVRQHKCRGLRSLREHPVFQDQQNSR